METTNQLSAVKPAVDEIMGLNSYESLSSIAVRETAARKVKAESVLSAVSLYEKIAVSSSVIKSVLTSYLHEIDETGFNVPSWKGRILIASYKYDDTFKSIVNEEPVKPEEPRKPEKPVKPVSADDKAAAEYETALKDYNSSMNEYNRRLSDYQKESAVYAAVMLERAAGVYREDKTNRVFIFSENPKAAGVKPENIKIYMFSSLRLSEGKFKDTMLSGDTGISTAAEMLKAVGVDNFIAAVEKAAGLNYELSDKERAFISSYVGVSLSERGEMLLLKARAEDAAALNDEEYEKAVKAAAKSIFSHLKKDGLTTAKKDRVVPAVIIELKRRY